MGSALLHHLDREGPALLRADGAALAVVEAHDGPSLFVDLDGHVGTELPADVALRARIELDHGTERTPARRRDHVARHAGHGDLGKVLLRCIGGHATTSSSILTRSYAIFAAAAFASGFAGTNMRIALRTASVDTMRLARASAPRIAVLTMG